MTDNGEVAAWKKRLTAELIVGWGGSAEAITNLAREAADLLTRLSAAKEEAERERDEARAHARRSASEAEDWKWAAGDREKERDSARADALEEAAKLADREVDRWQGFDSDREGGFRAHAKAIRALKPVQGEQ